MIATVNPPKPQPYERNNRVVPVSRRATAYLRMLPGFLIIGAQKGGTSSLYAWLLHHPGVLKAFRKEINFFDNYHDRGLGWYRAHFPMKLKARAAARGGRRILTGEASPCYLFHPLAAERAAGALPGAKIIALLRNPIDRALSHYHHQVSRGRLTVSFEEALDDEERQVAEEGEANLTSERYFESGYRNVSYRRRGLYADQLVRWFARYPRDRILIEKSEDLFERPNEALARILQFLGLSPWEGEPLPKKNVGSYERKMDAATRRSLARYFAPHNARLEEMLGRAMGWER